MEEYLDFMARNWTLFAALVVTIILLVMNFFGDRIRGFRTIDNEEAIRLTNNADALLLDIREQAEFAKDGRVKSSKHISLRELKNKLGSIETYKTKPVVVMCRSGNRSKTACAQLRKNGFEEVYNLKGGIIGWKNGSLPVVYK